jgi:predicted XRE-type DNA-binding protein
MMAKSKFNSVWDAIENTPAEAASLRVKSQLMMQLQEILKESGKTQGELATKLNVTQPRVSDLMRGRIELFSIESLIDIISNAGMLVEMKIGKKAA